MKPVRVFLGVLLCLFSLLLFPPRAVAQLCCYNQDSLTAFTSLLNTFYPTQNNISLNPGDTTLLLSAVPPTDVFGNSFGNVPIRPGDLILIIQMQGADFQFTNSNLYGAGQANSGPDGLGATGYTNLNQVGQYEWAIAMNAVPLTGGTLRFNSTCVGRTGLFYGYQNAEATASSPRKRFQVVRVPRFTNLKLTAGLVTTAWNDRVGGILAIDVSDTLDFNGYGILASEKGFRGGYQPVRPSGNNNAVYTTSDNSLSSGKGEGICGTPRYVWNGVNEVDYGLNWVGYPGGVYGRGAPGNAGGGGNIHNAGGGGGGNGGAGGVGGYATSGSFSETGGRPGGGFPLFYNRLFLGGGGGGGDANNATSGVKGGSGGGLVFLKTRVIAGNGFVRSNGGQGQPGGLGAAPDGSGGGGAGGTIVVLAQNQAPGLSLLLEARGGNGGHVLGLDHGPGGGGGGGFIFHSGLLSGFSTQVSAGIRGLTNFGNGIPYGASTGQPGQVHASLQANLPSHLTITTFPRPIAQWRADTVCLGDTTAFFNTSYISQPASISAFSWDFGDGNTSQSPLPRHRYDSAGNYSVTLIVQNVSGCSDTLQGWVRVLPVPSRTLSIQVCDSFIWNGQVLRQSGQYNRLIQASIGCDTVETLHLIILSQTVIALPLARDFNTGRNGTGGVLAGGQPDLRWEVAVNNRLGPYQTATVMNGIPGVYYSSPWPDAAWISNSSSGAHSVDIDLYFRNRFLLPCIGLCSIPIWVDSSFCLGLDFFSDNSVYEIYVNGVPQSNSIFGVPAPNPYQHIGYGQSGILSTNLCRNWVGGWNELVVHVKSGPGFVGFLAQSSVSLPPTNIGVTYASVTSNICSPNTYMFNGMLLAQSGVYRDTLVNFRGCDSIVTLTLQVNQPTAFSFLDTICRPNTYVFGGQALSQAGTYFDTLVNRAGCDSLVMLSLFVGEPDSVLNVQSVCDSLVWNGQTFRQTGTYRFSALGSDGCDSVALLQLTVRNSSFKQETKVACDSLEWNGGLYRQSGTYFFRAVNASGCDSTIQLNLSIRTTPEPPRSFDTTICIKDGSQIGYPWPLAHGLNWYRYPGDLQPFQTGRVCVVPWSFDSTDVYISYTASGCESRRVAVRIINDEYTRFPIRPTAFTPNDDGINDLWYCESQNVLFLQVFDRWGRLIHEDSGHRVIWNGGTFMPGSYPYLINMETCSGKKRITRGIIELIR
jgi:gliding motility-associated-like protein